MYDGAGNLREDGRWVYNWQCGRQLYQMRRVGETATFTYDHNGLRVGKTFVSQMTGENKTVQYTLHGKLITHMDVNGTGLHFFYDVQGRPAQVSYNGVIYNYIHNLQGDIVGILDKDETLVVEYKYDAWGKPCSLLAPWPPPWVA